MGRDDWNNRKKERIINGKMYDRNKLLIMHIVKWHIIKVFFLKWYIINYGVGLDYKYVWKFYNAWRLNFWVNCSN